MKKIWLLIVLIAVFASALTASAQKLEGLEILPDGSDMLKYGNPDIGIEADEFLKTFALGDIVTVTVEGYGTVDVPVCSNYDDVFLGEMLLRTVSGKPQLCLAIAYGQLGAELGIVEKAPAGSDYTFRIKEGVTFPIHVTIEMKEKGGYVDRLALGLLERTDSRDDYPELTDAEFANFREIATTGIGTGKLYRASSPVNPDIARNVYADKACEEAGIKTFINLSDSEAVARAYEGYDDSYYSKQNIIFLSLPVTFTSDAFKNGLAEGLRYMIANEAPYLIHCAKGKDRAGLTSAILEALMGAGLEEILDDYEKTYTNYYDVQDGKQQPIQPEVLETIRDIIVRNLAASFGVEDLTAVDLSEAAENYLLGIGLTADEIASLKAVLS
ncbi:MAG: tyrosine-protein phosphatase [Anaerolineaceae bacterium]|nr:tyrosine-protein phosphatase [Anaerolineaceae bacterium]